MTVFEDYPDDLLSLLFKAAYPHVAAVDFKYSKGNGALVSLAETVLLNSEETIFVYLDTIPGNESISKVYYNLKKLVIKYPGRLWVFPIVCAEYYFIRAFHEPCYKKSDIEINTVLNKGDYRLSRLLCEPNNKMYVKNFEKFCKLTLVENYIDCIKHTRGIKECNQEYGLFYNTDCTCQDKGYIH